MCPASATHEVGRLDPTSSRMWAHDPSSYEVVLIPQRPIPEFRSRVPNDTG